MLICLNCRKKLVQAGSEKILISDKMEGVKWDYEYRGELMVCRKCGASVFEVRGFARNVVESSVRGEMRFEEDGL